MCSRFYFYWAHSLYVQYFGNKKPLEMSQVHCVVHSLVHLSARVSMNCTVTKVEEVQVATLSVWAYLPPHHSYSCTPCHWTPAGQGQGKHLRDIRMETCGVLLLGRYADMEAQSIPDINNMLASQTFELLNSHCWQFMNALPSKHYKASLERTGHPNFNTMPYDGEVSTKCKVDRERTLSTVESTFLVYLSTVFRKLTYNAENHICWKLISFYVLEEYATELLS